MSSPEAEELLSGVPEVLALGGGDGRDRKTRGLIDGRGTKSK